MPRVDTRGDHWTFGCEHELSDWNCTIPLPKEFKRSPDYTIVNSNGIAAQPNVKVYGYGGEINTPPSDITGQVACLERLLARGDIGPVNHRSNLHVHIRVPGLKESLKHLKQLQQYIHSVLPKLLPVIEPIPEGRTPAEKKREKRRRVSHHTLLTKKRLKQQLEATTVQEFFEAEVPTSRLGKPMWHAQPRLAVGLRQMLQTDTIEFRHFPGTLNPEVLGNAICWCKQFLTCALREMEIPQLWVDNYKDLLPQFPPFDEELEIGYQATASHNGLPRKQVESNIQLILNGKFHASVAYQEARERAGC